MQNERNWFIDFLAEMVGKYADAENASCELDNVGYEAGKHADENENGGAEL